MMRAHWPLLLSSMLVGGGVTFFVLMQLSPRPEPPVPAEGVTERREAKADPAEAREPLPEIVADPEEALPPANPLAVMTPEGDGISLANPSELVGRLGDTLSRGDIEAFAQLVGSDALTAEAKERIAALASAGHLHFSQSGGPREVGELALNERVRWALKLDHDKAAPGRDRILIDLRRDGGAWSVEQVAVPPLDADPSGSPLVDDPLGSVDAFLQAVLAQDFRTAKSFVEPGRVSDAKIAGLCILFEEGEYRLRDPKPLRAMFHRDTMAGFLAHLVTDGGESAAAFSVTVERGDGAGWKLIEINLDQLLADYATRVAGGDVHYTPLVRNPKGGDTLVLYFEFDAAELTPRTRRQLGIVAEILKTNPAHRLTLSGHTDALGTEEYNVGLSLERADQVKQALVDFGVAETQIVAIAEGQTQPRRPNFTAEGGDDPAGRRANRRAEIYLDF